MFPLRGVVNNVISGTKSRGAFGQPAFFLAGNRMTIVAFEKEVSLKSLAKRLFNSNEVLNLRQT